MLEKSADDLQRAYYERTADTYDADHVHPGDENSIALDYIAQLARVVDATSVLDVGAGTGRGVRYLKRLRPDLDISGIEPVEGLRREAARLDIDLLEGSGENLPFPDDAFDIVIATALLHHVPNPDKVVSEMIRVARRGVMISDSNILGQGRPVVRVAKALMWATKTWKLYNSARTRGRGYMESEGDGIFYSYTIFDSHSTVSRWATRTFVIPTLGENHGRFGPIFETGHGLLVGLREENAGMA